MFARVLLKKIAYPCYTKFSNVVNMKYHSSTVLLNLSYKNIEIPLSWGKVRGKLYNCSNKDSKKIVTIHGWLDNLNSFEPLMPLLRSEWEILSFDLPGHGLSDHIPYGMKYDMVTYVESIYAAVKSIGWNKFIMLCHSMGGSIGIHFAAVFPEFVQGLVLLDYIVIPKMETLVPELIDWRQNFEIIFQAEKGSIPEEVFTKENAFKKFEASRRFANTPEVAETAAIVLFNRGAKCVNNYFMFTRDPRVHGMFIPLGTDHFENLLKYVNCDILFLHHLRGIYKKDNETLAKSLSVIKNKKVFFEMCSLDICHHGHISNPEVVASPVNSFLDRISKSM